MNPNAPSWGNQQNNQQSTTPQYNPYGQQAQQQYNPYAQQPQQQPQYNPYSQQPQQQFVPPQQAQQYQPQQQYQQPQQQYQQPQQPQQQQYNPYAQQQIQAQQPQFQAPQQPYYNQQTQYNNQQQMNAQYQQTNNPRTQRNAYQTQTQNNNDNWDSPDEQPRQYGTVRIQQKSDNNAKMSNLDKSDDDTTQNNSSQNTAKKKKKRRRGRNKNKNKDSNAQNAQNDKETMNAINAYNNSKKREKDNNAMNDITQNTAKMNIETPKTVVSQKEQKPKNTHQTPQNPLKKTPSPSPPKNPLNKKSQNDKPKKAKKSKEESKKDKSKKAVKEECKEKETTKKAKKSKAKWDKHDKREHVNLVLIGHVDAGKSTISGQILLATNQIDARTINKYKKEAKEKNRESWWIAYIMDEDDEERNKGKTVECGRAHFTTANKRYTILDAPGHKNYVPNMISGAQQADVAILVISARRGEFEAGFDRGGQTREHALLALTLGISRIVIVVNKMDTYLKRDTTEWSKERYDDIKTRVTAFLCETGFKKKYIDVLPISGQDATNIKTGIPKEICPWYNGRTLIETLDSLKKVKRATNDNTRIPVLDRYKGDKGLQAIGKVEAGIVKKGDTIMIMPTEVTAKIVGLSVDDEPVEHAGAGENVLLTFDKNALSFDQIYGGCVLCAVDSPTKVVESFMAEIYIHEIPGGTIMTKGYQSMFHSHNIGTLCEIEDIPHKLHKKTRKRSRVAPKFLRAHDSAIVKITINQKCALEPFEDCGALGRFTLRDRGKTVVIGKIIQIFASQSRRKINTKKGKGKEYKSDK